MLNKIIEFSIRNKLIIGIFILALIGYGIYEVKKLPIDAVPDITDNQVQVITITPSLGAPDVERLITFPIEQVNSNIPGLKKIRSFSRFGLSVVTIVFEDNVEVYWARQQVTERLQVIQDQIPKEFGKPHLAPATTGLGEIYQYTVRAKKGYENKYDAMQLRTIQDWIVRRQLLGVKGVADVSSFGGYLKQYEIAVNPNKLKAYNITINDVFTALQNNNQNTGGTYIERGPTALFIRSEGLVGSIDDIENILVKNLSNGSPMLIRDVAEVRLGHATRYGALTYNGKNEVSGAVVMMLKGANSNEVIKNIKERVAEIQKILPDGVVIDPFLDRTKMVNNAIGTVETNLLEGALIVVFVLVVFLGNLRAGFLVASVIPLSMLFAVIMMNTFGVSGNLMSLGALDFGLIVDGAVIIVEAVMHRLTHAKAYDRINKLTQQEMDIEVKESASRMMNSAVFGQVIILIVYLPIFTLQGIEGKMFKPMAQTVAFALMGAFILSLTYIPMMSALVLNKKGAHKKTFSDRMMEAIQRIYQPVLVKSLRFPKTILFIAIALFAGALIVLSFLGGQFIPSLEEGDYAIETRVLTGSNLNTSIKAVSQASQILLKQFPEVEKVVGKTGSSEIPTDPMPIDASDMMVILKKKKDWTSAKSFDELTEKMSKALEAVPGVTFGFQYPVQMRFNELMTGARQDVVCKLFGENLDTLATFAKKLGGVVNTVEGARDLYIETVTGMPQIIIEYKRNAIAQYGLNISEINRVVKAAFAGESSGLVYEDEKRFDLVVRLEGELRKGLEDVQNLLIPMAQGTQIPLYQVADVKITEGPNQIQREDAQRRIMVGFNVRGRDVQSMVKELQSKVEQQIKLPTGYHITYGGAFENLEAARKRLSIAVPVALLLILLMLYFAFNSIKHGLLIYSAIPLSAIGGILALAIRGMPFSISAGVGFIALFGVAVLNGIVLVAEFNRLKKEGKTDLKEIVLKGTQVRLRPVLMTASVASLGFLPMALSNGAGAEVQRPLATVVIGGLAIATLLTLIVLPVLYALFEKRSFWKRKSKAVSLIIIFSFATVGINKSTAQERITLQAAVDTAFKNNLELKSEQLTAEYLKELKGTSSSIPKTAVMGEYGNINSYYNDTKFGISQSINFPTIYSRQKDVLNEEWKQGLLNVEVKQIDLKRQVTEVYFQILYLLEKRKLLLQADTMYAEFLRRADLRFQKGETNILEKTTAETQRGQISHQLRMLGADFIIVQDRFKLVLNTEKDFLPADSIFKLPTHLLLDTTTLLEHPQIKVLQQQQNISLAQRKLEKSKMLPDLSIGYINQSFTGFQNVNGTETHFTGSDRFSSVQLGLGISIFRRSQRARIATSKISESIAYNKYLAGVQILKNRYMQAIDQYNKHLETINYYETIALINANRIINTANKQFLNGEINYLEWVLLMNQAIGIQNEYIDAVKNLNQVIIEINTYQNK
jgi:cobalt-zinc-cadmium resistance protein CzcA